MLTCSVLEFLGETEVDEIDLIGLILIDRLDRFKLRQNIVRLDIAVYIAERVQALSQFQEFNSQPEGIFD